VHEGLIRNGAVAPPSARITASPTGWDVQLDQRLLDALFETCDDASLANHVTSPRTDESGVPDCRFA
jgi:hypothetical protein